MQPDNIYRIDLQLDEGADHKAEAAEDKVIARIKGIVGQKPFRIDWVSVYHFRCMKLDRFVHGRVIFVGDSAHVVSPFGARGGNGGIQDVDNLGWKLAAVLAGEARPELLESYDEERSLGAAENIRNSSRSTNFMTPKSPVEALFRAEALRLAADQPFARRILNSGRLSVPCSLEPCRLQTASVAPVAPGTAIVDAPLEGGGWLIDAVKSEFTLVGFDHVHLPAVPGVARLGIGQHADYPCVEPAGPFAHERYGQGRAYLFRPDGHVCASFVDPTAADVAHARARALGAHLAEEVAA